MTIPGRGQGHQGYGTKKSPCYHAVPPERRLWSGVCSRHDIHDISVALLGHHGADAAAAIPGRDTGKPPSVEIERYRRPVIKKPLTD